MIGWQGIWLTVPSEWNLSAFRGTGWKGSLVLSDLRGTRMIVRWRRPRWGRSGNWAQREFDKLIARLRRRLRTAEFSVPGDGALQVDLPSGERLLVAHAAGRLLELQWLAKPTDGYFDAEMFLKRMRHELKSWEWKVFGIYGLVPAYARMKKAILMPGAARITWDSPGFVLSLGAISMADRLLQKRTLRQAVEKEMHLQDLTGNWSEPEATSASFEGGAKRRLLSGTIQFRFQFSHDVEENRIRWKLTTKRGFHRIWRFA